MKGLFSKSSRLCRRGSTAAGKRFGVRCGFLALSLVLGSGAALANSGRAVDSLPPMIKLRSPEAGLVTKDAQTVFKFDVKDPPAGASNGKKGRRSLLNIAGRSLTVGGENRTEDTLFYKNGSTTPYQGAKAPRGRLVYRPTPERPLPQGQVVVQLSFPDNDGNHGTFQTTITVDSLPPEITAVTPPGGATFSDPNQTLVFTVTDAVVGADPTTLKVMVNGSDFTGQSSLAGDQLTITPAGSWSTPDLTVEIAINDQLGNAGTRQFQYQFEQQGLAAKPRALPAAGNAPLTVQFIPDFETQNAVEQFEWDFDGDGTFDRSEVIGRNQTFTFARPGTYNATLRITDNNGEVATGVIVVQVNNAPPNARAEVTPSNGSVPLAAAFSVVAVDNEGIALYEWDFDGDGVFDYSSPTSGNTTHTYANIGNFQAVVRVTDNLGAVTTLAAGTTEVRAALPGSPNVSLTATPSQGDPPLAVTLNAVATDPDGQAATQYQWDYEGDGTFDADGTSATASYSYGAPGTFFPRVRVTMADGGIAEDVAQVDVNAKITLAVTTDTIDPAAGETVSINTTLAGNTKVSMLIEDRFGALVRTLVPWTERSAGAYTDNWDGSDSAGKAVPEGDFYAVMLYDVDGVVKRLDLRESTGGSQYNPNRSTLPNSFEPFNNKPLTITFSLPRASEVTAFMGRFNANTRLVTFLERKPLGRGSHTIVWNGESGQGQLIHPPIGDRFLFGIWGYTLADNAIFVRNGVTVSSVSASPPIFDPSGHIDDQGTPLRSIVSFDLSKTATVELSVLDAVSGKKVANRIVNDVASGRRTVEWDGLDDNGVYVALGRYLLGVTAVDAAGNRSLTVYTVQRVYF